MMIELRVLYMFGKCCTTELCFYCLISWEINFLIAWFLSILFKVALDSLYNLDWSQTGHWPTSVTQLSWLQLAYKTVLPYKPTLPFLDNVSCIPDWPGNHCVADNDLKFFILLLLLSSCWGCGNVPTCLVSWGGGYWTQGFIHDSQALFQLIYSTIFCFCLIGAGTHCLTHDGQLLYHVP